MARERERSGGIRGIGGGAEQLFIMQRLHAGMPLECKSGVAKGGIALRRDSKTWAWFTGTNFEPARFVGRNRLRVSANGKCRSRIYAVADINGKNDRALGQTVVAEIREREIRSLVRPGVIPTGAKRSGGIQRKIP